MGLPLTQGHNQSWHVPVVPMSRPDPEALVPAAQQEAGGLHAVASSGACGTGHLDGFERVLNEVDAVRVGSGRRVPPQKTVSGAGLTSCNLTCLRSSTRCSVRRSGQ